MNLERREKAQVLSTVSGKALLMGLGKRSVLWKMGWDHVDGAGLWGQEDRPLAS